MQIHEAGQGRADARGKVGQIREAWPVTCARLGTYLREARQGRFPRHCQAYVRRKDGPMREAR
jgi:hypothetical protein